MYLVRKEGQGGNNGEGFCGRIIRGRSMAQSGKCCRTDCLIKKFNRTPPEIAACSVLQVRSDASV